MPVPSPNNLVTVMFMTPCSGVPGPRGWHPTLFPYSRSTKSTPHLTIGLVVDPTFAGQLVDKGPPAEDAAAARRFRDFWGDKSELRRYGKRLSSLFCDLDPRETCASFDGWLLYSFLSPTHVHAGCCCLAVACCHSMSRTTTHSGV